MRIIEFTAPLNGYLIPLQEVKDEAISQHMLGEGFAIIPSDGQVYSPVNGTIIAMYPTGHAIGIRSDEGYEFLIHIGVNTFQLQGAGIHTHVKEGMRVAQQDLLVEFDKASLEAKGVDLTTSILFTNKEEIILLEMHQPVTHFSNQLFEIGEPHEGI